VSEKYIDSIMHGATIKIKITCLTQIGTKSKKRLTKHRELG